MEKEKRLIDANALSDEVDESKHDNPHPQGLIRVNHRNEHDHFLRMIMNAPTVDAVEVVHGRWIPGEFEGEYICSRCGMEYCEADPMERPYKYCPECGSKNE